MSQRVAFETARLSLARHKLAGDDCSTAASAHAAMVSAVALQVERVGIWRFHDERTVLRCSCLYTLSSGTFSTGDELRSADAPTYFAALKERRAVVAPDARTHRLTRELEAAYLLPRGISSILDAPVFFDGEVVGVVCHEHVGPKRNFAQHEIDFASSVADMVAMVDEQSLRLAMEVELRQRDKLRLELEKLEALRRLARTAAHDFNNALSTIMLASEPLTTHLDPAVAGAAQTVLDAAELAARMGRDLLVLGREAPMTHVRVRLDQIVDRLLPILRGRFADRATFALSSRVSEPAVNADVGLLERVVLNLGINAAEAISARGSVQLIIREATAQEANGRGWLVLDVIDDGAGMEDYVKAHLYEPYFTTKPRGSGIGLASVYGIVTQLGGRIEVDSVLGRGTRFSVILPAFY